MVIARTGSRVCPVAMLERYMTRTATPREDQLFLFRPIQRSSWPNKLQLLAGSIPEKLGFTVEDYGLHSMRAGGATAAANAKVPDRLFKRHGRWRSESAKDGYIKDSVESRLQVSRSLGLYLNYLQRFLWPL